MTQSSSSFNARYPTWQREYNAALVEADPEKILERVHAAETAIFNRLQELAQDSTSPDQKAERRAIEDALTNLRGLQKNNLGFPDWKAE